MEGRNTTQDELEQFLRFYATKQGGFGSAKMEVGRKVRELEARIKEMKKVGNSGAGDGESDKRRAQVMLVIHAANDGPVEITLSYGEHLIYIHRRARLTRCCQWYKMPPGPRSTTSVPISQPPKRKARR